jgi:ATP-binding cassette, subfamily G (WHITE), member 2, PDR
MSLVGNFAFGSDDRTVKSSGAPGTFQQNALIGKPAGGDGDPSTAASPQHPGDNPNSEVVPEVNVLARRMTEISTHSQFSGIDHDLFDPPKDSKLDPNSPSFSPRAWAQALLRLTSRDPEKFPERVAGIAFRGLNVYGYGSATDYQKSVANVALELVGLFRSAVGLSHKRKIHILRDFDGIVESGEMLVVLGPPGRHGNSPSLSSNDFLLTPVL